MRTPLLTIAQLEQQLHQRRHECSAIADERDRVLRRLAVIDLRLNEINGTPRAKRAPAKPKPNGQHTDNGVAVAVAKPVAAEKGPGLHDLIKQVMADGAPRNVVEVAKAVLAMGYKTGSTNFRDVCNNMMLRPPLVRVSRGVYRLAE